jgi:hypothetical protein
MNTTENLRFSRVKFLFSGKLIDVRVYPHEEAEATETYAFSMVVECCHLDWQVSSAAQSFNTLSQLLLTVEHLTFDHSVHNLSSEEHNVVDRAQWRQLLRSFRNVKTLRISYGLVREFSRCLQLDDGEPPLPSECRPTRDPDPSLNTYRLGVDNRTRLPYLNNELHIHYVGCCPHLLHTSHIFVPTPVMIFLLRFAMSTPITYMVTP